MPLLKNGKFVEDDWRALGDDEPIPSGEAIFVPLERLLGDEADELRHSGGRLGVQLRADQPVGALQPWIDRLSLIALDFPAFSDGRSYSAAAILRDDFGYWGELRAVGDVLVDQYQFMRRVGFDTFAIADGRSIDSWQSAIVDVSLAYQIDPSGSEIAPVWQARRNRSVARLAAE